MAGLTPGITHTHTSGVYRHRQVRGASIFPFVSCTGEATIVHSHSLLTEREREVKYSFVAVDSMRNYWTVQLSCAHFVVSRKKL